MSVDDVLKEAYEHVNECKDVDKTIQNILEGNAHSSDLAWVNRVTDNLVYESEKILERLDAEFKNAGWWKKKVIKSWYNDVGMWTARIKMNKSQLNYFKDKKS